MDKKKALQKIQELRDRVVDLQANDPEGSVDRILTEGENKARESVQTPNGDAFKVLARGLSKVQKDPRPDQLGTDLAGFREETQGSFQDFETRFLEQLQSLKDEVKAMDVSGKETTKNEVASLSDRLTRYEEEFSTRFSELKTKDSDVEGAVSLISEGLDKLAVRFDSLPDLAPSITQNIEAVSRVTTSAEDIRKALEELDKRLTNRINGFRDGGGNMNRSFLVGGDKDTLSKFTDINLKAGAGTTITYSANQTTQYTDITITATGAGAGITRSVNVVAIDTAAGSTASVDYVYVVSGTTTITLPTAVANTNLYTIKNVGSGTVTIATTGGETIDGSSNLVLPLQYTSVDLISNGVGWDIT